MAYVALYRQYRPKRFSEVAGQKHIVQTLQNAIKLNKVAHAYLFSGPRGTGKTTMAKILAKALNCKNGINIEPCCNCEICEGITKGNITDVIEIDAASNNGVDEIREIRDKVKYLPSVGRYKVYIIDEVHMLSTSAFNALLKTLEEPPAHVIFILATTEPQKIPATILSRCQRFDFLGIEPDDIKSNLDRVIKSEKLNVEAEAIDLISEICEGGMRDALSLLDQSIAHSTNGIIKVDDILSISGNISKNDIYSLLHACSENNSIDILKAINNIIDEGKEISKIVSDIIIYIRDLLMYKSNFGNKAIYKNEDFIKLSKIDNQILFYWLQELNNVQNNIRFTNQKRAYLELGLLNMADKEKLDYFTLVEKVEKLEHQISVLKNNVIEKNINPVEMKKEYKKENYSMDNIINEIKPNDSFITVDDVSKILYNANKKYKDLITNAINIAVAKDPNNKVFLSYDNGIVGAATVDSCILVLEDTSKCNRLMKEDNYLKFLELINKEDINLKEFICLPKDNWDEISKDYLSKFKKGEKNPILNSVNILVKKTILTNIKKNEPIIDVASTLFGENNFKIKGE